MLLMQEDFGEGFTNLVSYACFAMRSQKLDSDDSYEPI